MNTYLDMFLTFARIGGLTFGGGYAMLPMLQREVVENKGWATEEELMDYYAIGQSTPGIIALNVATFIGYKKKKLPGAVAATFGVAFPSLVIIMLIAMFISNFLEIEWVQHAFAAVRVCVVVLILKAIIKLWKGGAIADKKTGKIKIFALLIFLIVFALNVFLSVSPIWLVLLSGVLGILFSLLSLKMQQGKGGEA